MHPIESDTDDRNVRYIGIRCCSLPLFIQNRTNLEPSALEFATKCAKSRVQREKPPSVIRSFRNKVEVYRRSDNLVGTPSARNHAQRGKSGGKSEESFGSLCAKPVSHSIIGPKVV